MTVRRDAAYRRDLLWIAAQVHRISGLLLAAFLPLHFLALALALDGEARLDSFLVWTANPLVKIAEAGLIVLLAVHLLGGLRILAIENLPWRKEQKRMAIVAVALALIGGIAFLIH
ncbi:MAG: succinate dehydrogenase, cytochrome b subunit [Bacteroidota bacterium]|jgi:fumarate reductase subunit D